MLVKIQADSIRPLFKGQRVPRTHGNLHFIEESKDRIRKGRTILQEIETTIDAIEPGGTVGGFLARFVGEPLEQGVAIYEDILKFFQWRRQIRLMVRTEDFMRKVGLQDPSRHIPLSYAVHLFQAASLEEDDELQDLWAVLLVNWANVKSDIELDRSYISALLRRTPFEARIFEYIYSLPYGKARLAGVTMSDLLEEISANLEGKPKNGGPVPDIELALSNLSRLGCLTFSTHREDTKIINKVFPTLFGKRFLKACTLQKK